MDHSKPNRKTQGHGDLTHKEMAALAALLLTRRYARSEEPQTAIGEVAAGVPDFLRAQPTHPAARFLAKADTFGALDVAMAVADRVGGGHRWHQDGKDRNRGITWAEGRVADAISLAAQEAKRQRLPRAA